MTFDVYPDSEASTIPHNEDETISIENPDGKYLNASKAKHEEVVVGADFTVEYIYSMYVIFNVVCFCKLTS